MKKYLKIMGGRFFWAKNTLEKQDLIDAHHLVDALINTEAGERFNAEENGRKSRAMTDAATRVRKREV